MKGPAAEERRRSMAPLWAMVAIFAAPVIAAWFLFLHPEYLPAGRSNHGELIEPQVPLPSDLWLLTPGGAALDRSRLAGKWTLVYLAGGECGEECRGHLAAIRQIRLALGESQLSVERLLIMTDPAPDLAAELASQFEGMKIAWTDREGAARLLDLLGEGASSFGRIHILDPMGNLMMRYAPGAPPQNTLRDMERLLKASKGWIKGAHSGHQ